MLYGICNYYGPNSSTDDFILESWFEKSKFGIFDIFVKCYIFIFFSILTSFTSTYLLLKC